MSVRAHKRTYRAGLEAVEQSGTHPIVGMFQGVDQGPSLVLRRGQLCPGSENDSMILRTAPGRSLVQNKKSRPWVYQHGIDAQEEQSHDRPMK